MTYLRYIAIFALTAAAAVMCGRLYAHREDKWSVVLRALAAALLSYLAIQSGIARRLTPEALLPAWGGTAWPGRTALFLGLMVLFITLYATDRGEEVRTGLDRAMARGRWRWLAAAVMTGLFLLWTWRVTVVTFMTNDDVSIMRAIARIPGQGLTAAAGTFSHILFCAFLGFFYRLDPEVCWYGVYHIAAIALSLVIIGRCILAKASLRGWPAMAGLAVFALVLAGLALPVTAELSFTVTPAVAGTAAAALVLCRGDAKSRAGRALTDAGSVILTLLCYLQRTSTGRAVLCFWALAVGYQLLKLFLAGRPGRLRRLVPLLLCAAVTLGLLHAARRVTPSALGVTNRAAQAAADSGVSYNRAEHYRSIVMDYLVENLTNEQLEAAGLPPELSNLLRSWYFMDERINTETFKAIADMYYDPSPETGSPASGSLAAATAAVSPEHLRTMALMALTLPLLLILAAMALFREGRRYWPEFLCALCAAGGAAILFVYLIRAGRFPLRVFLVVAVPAAVTLLLMALAVPDERREGRRSAIVFVPVLLLAALCCLTARSVHYTDQALTRADVFASQRATEGYANAHPDVYFVTNFIRQDLDPFHPADSYPSNLHLWGGTGVTADPDRLYADAFFRDDVQFMYETSSTVLALLQYLTLDFGPVQAVSLAQLDASTFVVDLDQLCPAPGYTGWYEQNGMTYYFRDGEALTGEQTVDGESYTFAPAGARSSLAVALDRDGAVVYTTDAYSLLTD